MIRLLALALAFGLSVAHAQEPDHFGSGRGPVCDTQMQIELFAQNVTAGENDPIAATNEQLDIKNACGVVRAVYVSHGRVGVVKMAGDYYEIIRITVIGVATSTGILPVQPSEGFTLFHVDDKGA